MTPHTFPHDFLWGVATASYQVEGAADEDGRGASIWDVFSRMPGKVLHGHTGDRSVDQYHRFPEDVALMGDLGVEAYRFSIAWPRVQPGGSGAFNERGFDYYRRLTDELHGAGIKATATLYHWDLPQPLEDAGGWPNRDTAYRFAEYAEETFRRLGGHVDMWITLNEAWCSSVLGYYYGVHAPGRTSLSDAWAAGHHLLLGHGLALQAYRGQGGESEPAPIGITHNLDTPHPATKRPEDVAAADRAMDLRTRFFLDPILGKGYPERHFTAYPGETPPPVREGDMELIAGKIDFLGLNFYHEPTVAAAPIGMAGEIRDGVACHPEGYREVPTHHPRTAMDWPVTPRGLYRHLRWVWDYTKGAFPLYITENGCAMDDELSPDGIRCHDPRRVDYLREHFRAALDAIADGVDLRGYFIWSLIDNFEWAYGYTKRFGIIYADFINLRRVPKDSYYYLRGVISGAEDRI
ncbi:MAG: GH1 family beta-glucosidase [Alkalispirochaeta sp.]